MAAKRPPCEYCEQGYGELVTPEGQLRHIWIPLCAYGTPPELPEGFLAAENPFTV